MAFGGASSASPANWCCLSLRCEAVPVVIGWIEATDYDAFQARYDPDRLALLNFDYGMLLRTSAADHKTSWIPELPCALAHLPAMRLNKHPQRAPGKYRSWDRDAIENTLT
jgi:hypothetical protein